MIKVLSIGNSFSQDAHRWLQAMADAAGDELQADILAQIKRVVLDVCGKEGAV